MRAPLIGLTFLALACSAGVGQAATPNVVNAFVHAVTDICEPNVMGRLPFNPPSDAQTAAGLLLADPTAPDELAPFKDLSLSERIFGGVNSTTGGIIVASDPSQNLCRVVVVRATDDQITAIQRALITVSNANGGWTATPSNTDAGRTEFIGVIGGTTPLHMLAEVPSSPSQGYGAAGFIFTLVNPK